MSIVHISECSLSSLVTIFNNAVLDLGSPKGFNVVKKFGTKPLALDRIARLMDTFNLVFDADLGKLVPAVEVEPTITEEEVVLFLQGKTGPVAEVKVPAPVEVEAEVAPAPKAATRRGEFTEDEVVELLTDKNPKRGNRGIRFSKYVNGGTVRDYLDSCVKLGHKKSRSKYRADIRWDLDHGFIRLLPAVV